MRYRKLSLLVPCALLLSACTTTVTPAYKDNGSRSGSCVEGGPDSVAQQFYDYRIQHRSNDITALRPYLSDNLAKLLTDASRDQNHSQLMGSDPFSSRAALPDSASVASASTIPNSDARNIPLRVELKQGTQSWRDEVLMIHEGQCWVIDDVRYLGGSVDAPAGTLRQSIENR
ncbi:lipoprotein [Citrobacter sp. Awk 4]|uniref:lipoprotein n=1 Tax=Citrobacter sp. Awk 4 TaxID=2963955 RepID=UPI002304288A|nr:lipoprotein [Citrobacter sp. Awk 4]MDA8479574.1 lipoprotein [Citrobacter sp. Awk 4]